MNFCIFYDILEAKLFKDSLNIAICNRSKNYKTIIENQWFKSKLNRCLYSLTYHAWIFIFLFCISTADFSHKYCLLSLWNVGFSNLCSTNWFSYHSDFKIIVSYEKILENFLTDFICETFFTATNKISSKKF